MLRLCGRNVTDVSANTPIIDRSPRGRELKRAVTKMLQDEENELEQVTLQLSPKKSAFRKSLTSWLGRTEDDPEEKFRNQMAMMMEDRDAPLPDNIDMEDSEEDEENPNVLPSAAKKRAFLQHSRRHEVGVSHLFHDFEEEGGRMKKKVLNSSRTKEIGSRAEDEDEHGPVPVMHNEDSHGVNFGHMESFWRLKKFRSSQFPLPFRDSQEVLAGRRARWRSSSTGEGESFFGGIVPSICDDTTNVYSDEPEQHPPSSISQPEQDPRQGPFAGGPAPADGMAVVVEDSPEGVDGAGATTGAGAASVRWARVREHISTSGGNYRPRAILTRSASTFGGENCQFEGEFERSCEHEQLSSEGAHDLEVSADRSGRNRRIARG